MSLLCKFVNRSGGILLAGATLLAAGCATHSQNAGMAITKLKTGDTDTALRWSEKLKQSTFSKDLGYLESGRVKMLSGDFAGSRADFATEIDKVLEETETGPAIRAGSIGSTLAASTVTDDTLREYQLSPYELIQLLHYQTLNYFFSGDPEGAGVEMRRTVFAQDAIAEKYSGEIEKAQEHASANQAKAMDTVQAKMAAMGPALERTSSSYENGLAWYFCGLVFEKQGDAANASLCYRKAWELAPGNTCVLKDFLRMLRTQDQQAFNGLAAQNNVNVNSLTRSSTEIVVLYEDSMISQRQAEKIPVPIPDFRGAIILVSIDFPFYYDAAYMPKPLTIEDGGTVLGTTEPAAYLQSLAYRDLKDKMPGIVVRNVTRAATKVIAQEVANNRNDDLVKFGMMAINAVSSLASTSDTRAWYSIPMVTHLYRGPISPGAHTLQFRNTATGSIFTVPVTVTDGETRLVWIADTGGITAAATASLSGKGLPPTFHQYNNPFHTNTVMESLHEPVAGNPVGKIGS
ncbi:MAG: hypothetical protein WC334_06090 [Kiritimatiellales bacterium]